MRRPQPAPLVRLVYVSHLTAESVMNLEAVMRDILTVSHRRNQAEGLTGLLLSNGYWFLQALEGPEAAVDACFARIALDPRHSTASVRTRGPAPSRDFARWSMCGLTLSGVDDALLTPPDIEFDVWNASPGALLQLLTHVAERYGRKLDAAHRALRVATESAKATNG